MEAYTDFATVYDTFMDETPYEKWCLFLEKIISKYGIRKGDCAVSDPLTSERNLVVDLGCGTGTLTEMMAKKGYDMIGIDLSADMLQIALQKKEKNGSEVLYLQQDMRELDLYCTAGTIISVCDSLNYILSEEELLEVFKKVNRFLYPGGLFIFDFNTVYKYKEIIGDTTIAENREDCSFIWENYYMEEEQINEYDVTVFVKDSSSTKEFYHKFTETHYQRGYTIEQMTYLIEQAGMKIETIVDADTQEECTKMSERVYFVVRENGKERK